jgi:hypothetical protein
LYEPKGLQANLLSTHGTVEENEPFIASAGAEDCRFEINARRGPEIVPVRLLTRSGRGGGPVPQTLDYPAPAVAIPDPSGHHRPPDTPEARPSVEPPNGKTKPTDKLLAKPAEKPPGGNARPRK